MAEIPPELKENLEEILAQVREIALGFENTEEYAPWGNRAFFRDIKGCNFLFANPKDDYLNLVLRLPKSQKAEALQLPFIEPDKSLGEHRGWLSAKVHSPEELEIILPWLKISYNLNNPFRGKADTLEGENSFVLEALEEIREKALSFGDIEEFFPYGGRAFRKRKGQIFLHADELEEYLNVTVRLPLGEREFALNLPYVEIPKYIGNKGWVSAKIRSPEELEIALAWVEISFHMNQPVRKKALK